MSSGRILVADDEPSVRDAVGYALEQEGFEVTLAVDGDDADGQLGESGPGFDLLILDIMMPGKSGLDICREVRAHSPVPIILLTAKDAEVDKVVGLEVGADDYVTKPFSVRELLGRVRAQLRRRGLDRSSTARDGKTIDVVFATPKSGASWPDDGAATPCRTRVHPAHSICCRPLIDDSGVVAGNSGGLVILANHEAERQPIEFFLKSKSMVSDSFDSILY